MYIKFSLPKWLVGVAVLPATAEIHPHSAGWRVLMSSPGYMEMSVARIHNANCCVCHCIVCCRVSALLLFPTGFIDFIVEPTFTVLTDMIEKIVTPLIEEASRSGLAGFRRSR